MKEAGQEKVGGGDVEIDEAVGIPWQTVQSKLVLILVYLGVSPILYKSSVMGS